MLDILDEKAKRPTNVTLCYAEDLTLGQQFYIGQQYTKFTELCTVRHVGAAVISYTREGGPLRLGIYFDQIVARVDDTEIAGVSDV